MNVTLRQLRAFVAVARTGSFTLAAESLFITQSALSGLIKEMERAMGLTLVDRSTRRLQLSEIGREFYPLIDKILHDLDRALTQVSDRQSLKVGLVRVAAPQLMASTLLPEVIRAYGQVHPNIRIRLVDCVVEGVMGRVLSGEVDLGIGPERDAGSDIAATTVFEGPFMAVFPHDHPLHALPQVCWTDIVDYPLITLEGQFTEKLSVDLHATLRGLKFEPTNEVAFMSTAMAMVNAGMGVTVCMSYAASLVQLYGLAMRPIQSPEVSRRFFLFTRQGRSLSPAADSFRHFLLQYMAQHGAAL